MTIEKQKKRCSKCKQVKLRTEFNKDKKNKDDLSCRCKTCRNEYNRQYRKANPRTEKDREREKKYREANPEKVLESSRKFREANPEKVLESSRKYYRANAEKVKARKKKDISELRSVHIKSLIHKKYKIPYELISEDMIDRERELIQINRLFRSHKNDRTKKTKRR